MTELPLEVDPSLYQAFLQGYYAVEIATAYARQAAEARGEPDAELQIPKRAKQIPANQN